jgi:ubiquinone/menaquinone biosynthesis C-methylase UbiE
MITPRLSGAESARIRKAYLRREQNVPGDRYSVFKEENLIARQQLEKRAISPLRRQGFTQLEQREIPEIGCGSGFWLRQFVQWGAKPENLVGIDLLSDSIVRGKELCPNGISLQCGDANSLDFEKDSFDVVTQFTVFSSVLDQGTQANLADEICRVTKPGGVIRWFDFFMSNPKNPDVRRVTHLRIRQLFPGWALDLGRVILAPPIARFVAPFSPSLCRLLSMLKPLCTHYLGIIKKP